MSDELPDFGDRTAVEEWLRGQPREVEIALAARSALRTLPLLWAELTAPSQLLESDLSLSVFRAAATSWFCGLSFRNGEAVPVDAACAAAQAVSFVADDAVYVREVVGAMRSAALAAADLEAGREGSHAARAVSSALYAASRFQLIANVKAVANISDPHAAAAARATDVAALVGPNTRGFALAAPLWRDGTPDSVSAAWARLKAYHLDRPDEFWSVWTDWYEARLRGDPPDWELERARVLDLDDFWEQGPKAVNAEIARRMAEILSRRLPLAEDLEQDPETGRFEVRPRPVARPDLLTATLDQVAEAVEDVVAEPSDGLDERALEIIRLRRLLERHANDPQRIEMTLTTVHGMVTAKIASEELPPSDGNTALLTAMQEGALAIRATHPEVAENRRLLQEQAIRELPPEAVTKIEDAAPVLDAITEGELQTQMREDVLFLTQEMRVGPPRPPGSTAATQGRDETVRLFGRVARMYLTLRRASPEAIRKVRESTGYQLGEILLWLSGLITLGSSLFLYITAT